MAGVLFAAHLSEGSRIELQTYLVEYLKLVQSETAAASFTEVFLQRGVLLGLAVLLSTSPLGVPGLPILFGWSGFVFTYSVSCCYSVFGGKGLLPALALFGLPELIWLPLLFEIGSRGMVLSYQLFRSSASERMGAESGLSWGRVGVYCVLLCVCVLIETAVVPVLLRASAQMVI